MKIQYFEDSDTLRIIFRVHTPAETRDLEEDILVDLDEDGHVCAMTFENASEHIPDHGIQFERIRRWEIAEKVA